MLSFLINKIPLSNHVPIIKKYHPNNNNNNNHNKKSQFDSNISSDNKESLINNRINNNDEFLDDEMIYDSPEIRPIYLSKIDNSSMIKVSQRLSRNKKSSIKSKRQENLINQQQVDDYYPIPKKNQDKLDYNTTASDSTSTSTSTTITTEDRLVKLIYDNRKSIIKSVYQIGKNQLSSRLPYIPYINSKQQHKQQQQQSILTTTSSSGLLDSPFTDYCQQVTDYEITNESDSSFDTLITNEDDVDIFIDSLDDKTKALLYNSLKNDLKYHESWNYYTIDDDNNNNSRIKEVYYNKKISFLDKLQIFLIIWIKLWITSIKLIIPITKYLIYKFQNNHLYLFNFGNFEKLIDLILKFMNYLNSLINNHESTINKMSNHDYIEVEEEIYLDFTSYTSKFFNPSSSLITSTFKEILFSPDINKQ